MILCGALRPLSAFASIAPVCRFKPGGYGYHPVRPVGWGGGHWLHDRHDGRLGWWWVVGPSWYFYPRPYAVVQPLVTVIVEQAPGLSRLMQQAPYRFLLRERIQLLLLLGKATGNSLPGNHVMSPGVGPWMTALNASSASIVSLT